MEKLNPMSKDLAIKDKEIPAKFKPRARLLLQLGDQLIKNESIALVELVKNSYDADSNIVNIYMENVDDENSVIPLINKEKYQQLLQDKKLADGILPKIDNAFAAINSGVKEVLVGDAGDLLQNCTGEVRGTLFK